MHIFFDVDYTLLAMDGSLRPGAREVLARLRAEGFRLYIWSGMGVRWHEVRQHRLDPLVLGVYEKPLYDYEASLPRLGIPVRPDLVVDDHPGIVQALGGIVVRPYFWPNPEDREMERVYRIILQVAREGTTEDPTFHPRRG